MNKHFNLSAIAAIKAILLTQTTLRKQSSKNTSLHFCITLLTLMLLFAESGFSQNLYWRTDGSSQSWISTGWGATATATGGSNWTSASNAIFTKNSSITYVSQQPVSNITLTGTGTVVTMTKAGTFSNNGKISTIDVCSGCILNWGSQLVSTISGTGFKKTSAGTWNIGGSMNYNGAPGGITINAGTVIVTSVNSFGGTSVTMNGGTLQSNGIAFNFGQFNIGASFVFSGTGSDTYSMPTFLSSTPTITDSTNVNAIRQLTGVISGNYGLTFNGTGMGIITMGGANVFTGPVTLSGGEVCFANDATFGAVPLVVTPASIIIEGGKLTTAGIDTYTSVNYTLDSKRGIQVGANILNTIKVDNTSSLTYNGIIANKTGTVGTWAKQGSGLVILGGNCTYTGATSLNNGTIKLTTNALPATTILKIGQSASINLATLDMNGNDQTIAGLVSISGLNTSSNKDTITSILPATLTINTATTNIFGNGTTINSGVITGAISLVKNGIGTQTFGDANTYTGTTTINAGILNLITSGSLSAASSVSISTNGTLSGTGTVNGITDLFGTISPAGTAAIGTLTTGNLTLESGGIYQFDVNKTVGTLGLDWDNLVVGTLTNNTSVGFNFTIAPKGTIAGFVGANSYHWIIGSYTGTAPSNANITVNTSGITNAFSGSFSVDFSSNNINLIYSTCTVGLWQGSNSSWTLASNWCQSIIPSGSTNVLIPISAYYPIINTVATVNNLTIASGVNLNVTGTLQVAGLLNNSGNLDMTTGMLELNGNTPQTIQGSQFTGNTISSLKINNSAGVTIGSPLNITDSVIPLLGVLNTGDFLTLKSSSAKTARMAKGDGNYLTGNVTVERFITAKEGRRYSFIGSSVTQSIRNSWQQQIYITGSGNGGVACGSTTGNGAITDKYNTNGFDASQFNAATILNYKANAINGSHYLGISNTAINLVPGFGYVVNIRGDRNSSIVSCANQLTNISPTAPEAVTLISTGIVTTGDLQVILNDTSIHKLTLLANPYPSQLSFSNFQTSNSIINNKMWMYSPFGTGNFTTYLNGHVANGATGFNDTYGNTIAIGQAFFVEANANGDITFSESHKTNGFVPNTQYFGVSDKSIRVGLFNDNDVRLDEIILVYSKQGSLFYNEKVDASSMSLASQSLVLLKGNKRLSIAEMPDISTSSSTIMGVSVKLGKYFLSVSDLETIDKLQTVTLVDRFLGITLNLRNNPKYKFNVTTDTASKGNNRFIIVLGGIKLLPINLESISANQNSTGVLVQWNSELEGSFANYSLERSVEGMNYEVLQTGTSIKGKTCSFQDFLLPKGVKLLYYRIAKKNNEGEVSFSKVATVNLTGIASEVTVSPNPAKNILTIKLVNSSMDGSYKAEITTIAGKVIKSKAIILQKEKPISIAISNCAAGIYILILTNKNGYRIFNKYVKE